MKEEKKRRENSINDLPGDKNEKSIEIRCCQKEKKTIGNFLWQKCLMNNCSCDFSDDHSDEKWQREILVQHLFKLINYKS